MGQVSGKVFRDFDGDGQLSPSVATLTGARSTSAPIEPGVPGVLVRAYVELSTAPITTTTGADGSYSFSSAQIPAGQRVRLEFANWERGYYPAPHNPNGGGTTVQFITAPATNIDAGINYPNDYCQPGSVQITIPCFVNGDPLKTADNGTPIDLDKQAGPMDALVSFDYNAFSVKQPGANAAANAAAYPPLHWATAAQVGAIWAVALQRRTKQAFSVAVVKRHAGFGPLGLGGIYKTDLTSTANFPTEPFLNLPGDLGISVGAIGPRDLSGNKLLANSDPEAMTALGRVGLGGTDFSEDDKTLYVVNLFDKRLYSLEVGMPAQKPNSTTGVKSWAINGPTAGCPQGEFRPWAVKVYRGGVYVAGVCSGEYVNTAVANVANLPAAIASNTVLSGHVFRLDPSSTANSFQPVMSFPLSFRRGSADLTNDCAQFQYWLPWTNKFPETCNANFVLWPQPMITDLEFDVDGHMVIGMLDRFGHLAGVANHDPNGNGFYDGFTGGDLLRAAPAGGILYELERNGIVGAAGAPGSLTSLNGRSNMQGPGNGEFYSDDSWMYFGNKAHDEIANGSLVLIPGKNEVLSSAYDPIDEIYKSSGWRVYNNTTGERTRGFVIVIDNPGTFGKSSGLGDSEPICDAPPVEIGNRFWYDDNRNGIQDAYEPGIDGLVIRLYDGNTLVASTTTANGGQWYFNNGNVPGGLKFQYRYQVRMDMSQLAALNLKANPNNPARLVDPKVRALDVVGRIYTISPYQVGNGTEGGGLRDSDATQIGGEAIIDILTGDMGQNDQNYDFSVFSCPIIEAISTQLSVCQGQTIPDITFKVNYLAQTDKLRFVCFDTPQTDPTVIYSGTNVLGTVTPNLSSTAADGSVSVTLVRPTIQTNTNATTTTFKYIYAILDTPPQSGTAACTPLDDVVITILPKPRIVATGGRLTCAQTSVTLTAQATNAQNQPIANGIYRWTGPNNFTSNAQNPVVSTTGTYSVSAASPDCPSAFNTTTVVVDQDIAAPVIVDAIGGVPACSTCTVTISATFTPANSVIRWTGPNGFTSNVASPTVSAAGFYTIVVTGPNGCTAETDVEVQPPLLDPLSSLGDYVWRDTNNNSLQDDGNTGVSGVTVELYSDTGTTPINSTTTNVSGFYSFTGLTAGCYRVKFISSTYPTDFVSTTARVGSSTALDSDADPITGFSQTVCLGAGENNMTIDAGLVEKSLIVKFESICIRDTPFLSYTITPVNFTPTSASMATITIRRFFDNSLVEVRNNQPLTDRFLWPGAVVDAQGNPIDWPGWELVNGQWIQVNDGLRPYLKFEVSLNPVASTTANYPDPTPLCISDPPARLGDYVWKDTNNNGIQDDGNTGVGGVTVELYSDTGTTPINSTTTNTSGLYSFTGLKAACYRVKFLSSTFPTDFVSTTALMGNNRALDSDADPITGLSPIVCLTVGENNQTIDAGLVEKSLIVNFKSICIRDTPYLSYTITPVNFTPTSASAATITIRRFMDNSLVEVKNNQPLTGTFLWPGAVVDAQGNPIDWPGWDFVNGEWIQINDGLRPYLKFEASVNPVASTTADYPGPQPACIPGPAHGLGDYVWKDLNSNGIQDDGNSGIANFVVELYSVTNGVRSTSAISTTTTDATGYYLFPNLPFGDYQVRFVPSSVPADCIFTQPFAGFVRGLDSNADATTGFSDVITLSGTDTRRPNRTVDAGLKPCPQVCVPIKTRRIR
jgi:hypothetical protein